MRPVSLHLAGFTAFRSPTDIDFTGADLFALTGPTGSGKSSIIDAICFALYGSIPRLSGVAPVVSLGKAETRIRLVFEVEGESYTVSRLIVRQGEGAAQRDVRLEGVGFAIEGVREVDARISRLLGLGFDHFTRTVVLPQGRFAAFLEDGPAAREKLLKQLLDLGVYEEMRKRGAGHASRLEGEIGVVDAQLHDLLVDASQVAETEARLERLEQLRERIAESAETEEKATTALGEARVARERVVVDLARLDGVKPPEDLTDLGRRMRAARAAAEAAAKQLADREATVARLNDERMVLGELAALDRAIEAYGRASDFRERVAKGRELLAATEARQKAASAALSRAEAAVEAATAVLRDLERTHAAHAIRSGLKDGDPCPVCLQTIATVPSEAPPTDLARAERDLGEARHGRDRTATDASEVTAELARLEGLIAQRSEELAAAEKLVETLLPLEQVMRTRDRVAALDAELATARELLKAARQESAAAGSGLQNAERAGTVAAEALDRVRDSLAGLEPPVPDRADPARAWAELMEWCSARRSTLEARRTELDGEVARREEEVEGIRRALRAEAVGAGLDDTGDDPRVSVAAAVAATETTLSRLRSDLDKKQGLGSRRKSLEAERARYDGTARLLRSNRFQQWLIEEALVGLVEFANAELVKLADGAYSLVVDGGEFEVIDHRNAEARRSVKTLSGGETFLVSLALALALAERVVATSAIGTARIESMFLDEGFGTLDSETLDTVASVVQELGSRERMLGLVTHVRELAEQMPTRFEVRKLADGATVTRVDL